MVRNKLCSDASYTVGLSKQRKVGLDRYGVPLFWNLRPSTIYSVPCDQIVQRAYSLGQNEVCREIVVVHLDNTPTALVNVTNRPRSIYQYSNIAPRLSG